MGASTISAFSCLYRQKDVNLQRKNQLRMKTKAFIISGVISFMLLSGAMSNVQAQCGNSTPSTPWDCDPEYLWPPTIQPCPEVQIKQKHDHTSKREYRELGWDTAVTCNTTSLVLSCTPYIPVQNFNGCYTVDEIPYNPVDPSFHQGEHLNIASDDAWDSSPISFPFTFTFFGLNYNSARVGSNGLLTFSPNDYTGYCAYQYQSSAPIPNASFPSRNAIVSTASTSSATTATSTPIKSCATRALTSSKSM